MSNNRGVMEYRADMTDREVLDLCLYGFKTHQNDAHIHKRMAKLSRAGLVRAVWSEASIHPSYRTTDAGVAKMREGKA